MKTILSTLTAFLLVLNIAYAQGPEIEIPAMPKAFLIGEFESNYELLIQNYDQMLMSVCENDMDVAFEKWTNFLSEMEVFSDEVGFDLKGIKIWLNVFWNADGTIRHIAFYPKANSKNMQYEELSVFFEKFTQEFQMELPSDVKYSHYGSASFPTFYTFSAEDKE